MRIIGGRWRGRRLQFPSGTAIRPTPDRVRETLFNWLAGRVVGAACLDLFAGSGALGMEALSRGAACVVFVDRDARSLHAIESQYAAWRAAEPQLTLGEARYERSDARTWLSSHKRPRTERAFDLVFLDPPFADDALAPDCLAALERGEWLARDARVYLELPGGLDPSDRLPPGWTLLRTGRAGEVGYHLCGRAQDAA